MSGKKAAQSPGDRRKGEIAACFTRADLKPAEPANTGFRLELHYRATVASPVDDTEWDLPGSRPTIAASSPK